MHTRLATALFISLAALAAHASESAPHWGYSGHGPEEWGQVPGGAACKLGKVQSPIDIHDARQGALAPLDLHYRKAKASIVDNGHTVQIDLAGGGFMNVDGVAYKLVQFHFHAPSEHTLAGQASPLELHLVHTTADGKLAVGART